MRHRPLLVLAALTAASLAGAQQRFGPRDVDALPSRQPLLVAKYGTDSLQFGELRLPMGPGPFPVGVVIHGGCWTAGFATLRNTAALASVLVDEGIATWNIEYRQVGNPGAGWPGSFLDVGAAVDYVRTLARQHPLDTNRVVVLGHSAGAHLALWAAARPRLPGTSEIRGANPLRPAAAVAIDGPGDLKGIVGRDAQICGRPVVSQFVGGMPEQVAARYAQASPIERLPIGVPQYLVAGPVLTADEARAYQARAGAAGDNVTVHVSTAGHFDVIAPGRDAFPGVLVLVRAAFRLPMR